jgi:hypothetical protein
MPDIDEAAFGHIAKLTPQDLGLLPVH